MTYDEEKDFVKQFRHKTLAFLVDALNTADPGHSWTATGEEGNYPLCLFESAQGERFSICLNRQGKNTLTVYGQYGQKNGRVWIPRDYLRRDDPLSDPQPSMSASKTATQIAADIVRRFLPDYRACRALYLKVVKDAADYQQQVETFAAELTALSNGVILFADHRNQNGNDKTGDFIAGSGVSGSIRVYPGSVRFDITSFDADLMRDFAKLLAERQAGAR